MWGSSFLWIKLALGALSPVQIALIRLLLGAVVLVVIGYARRQRLPRDPRVWAHMVAAALFGNAIPFVLFGVGEQTVGSGIAGVLTATTPLWALLIGIVIGTDRGIGVLPMLGLVLGFCGTLLIFSPWQTGGLVSWGAVECLAAAASYAVSYAYIGQKLSGRGLSPLSLSAAQMVTATGLVALAVPVAGAQPVHPHLPALIAVGVLGIFGTGFAFAVNYRLIEDEGATRATSVGYLLPVVSVLLGAIVLGEPLNPLAIIGMVVVLVGVALSRKRPPVRAVSPVPIPRSAAQDGQVPTELLRSAGKTS